jgi:hypothetical protein
MELLMDPKKIAAALDKATKAALPQAIKNEAQYRAGCMVRECVADEAEGDGPDDDSGEYPVLTQAQVAVPFRGTASQAIAAALPQRPGAKVGVAPFAAGKPRPPARPCTMCTAPALIEPEPHLIPLSRGAFKPAWRYECGACGAKSDAPAREREEVGGWTDRRGGPENGVV